MEISIEYPRFHVKTVQNNYDNLRIRKKILYNYDLHWHDCFEIELILNGKAHHELNGEKYELSRGDIYLLNPTDLHSVKGDGTELYNVMFGMELIKDDILQKMLSARQNLVFHLEKEELEHVICLMDIMLKESQSRDEYSDKYIADLLECIILTILRGCSDFSKDERAGGMKKALLYLHGNFQSDPSMTSVAERFGFNPNYFSARFHKLTGKTFKQYLNMLKLDYAKKLLLSGDMPVKEICHAAGFLSLANFLRSFKAQFGMTPKALRQTRKNELIK